MKPLLAMLLALPLLAFADEKKDQVIHIDDKDPEMIAAMAKARESLPKFWSIFDNPVQGEKSFALKVAITDPNGTEHFWVTDIKREDGKIMGTINNDPFIVANVKNGDRIEVPEKDISDWLYIRTDRKMAGNYTMRPLLRKMRADEAAEYEKLLAEP